VAEWAEAGALELPRRRYLALWRNLDVVSVGRHTLALRGNLGVFRRFWVTGAADLVLWIVFAVLSEFGFLPEHLPWGAGHSVAFRALILLGIPFGIGFLQKARVKRSPGPAQRDVITISKSSPHVLIRGPLGERSVRRADCWVWQGTMGYDSDVIEHRIFAAEECLVRWWMSMQSVDTDMDLLKDTVASYFGEENGSKNEKGKH
jgi:hypothetical protein